MTHLPDDRPPAASHQDRAPNEPAAKRVIWPWVLSAVVLIVAVLVAVFLLTPPDVAIAP